MHLLREEKCQQEREKKRKEKRRTKRKEAVHPRTRQGDASEREARENTCPRAREKGGTVS
jgi:hypothetical protein